MNKEECFKEVNKANNYLEKNLWMDFEICRMNEGQIILSGKLDELDSEVIEIAFLQPFMISCLTHFSYDYGELISLIQGEEAIKMNKKYKVEQGNYIFKLSINDSNRDFFVIAKEINVNIVNKENI